MNQETKNIHLQIHLAEYSALRAEILSIMKWSDSLVFISLGISGTLYSFAFSQSGINGSVIQPHWTALYLVTPLSTLVGGLWMVNGWRISRIGLYIRDEISMKLNKLAKADDTKDNLEMGTQVMLWESSNHRIKYKWKRRSIEWVIYLTTFVLSGVLAQILLIKDKVGTIPYRISNMDFPLLFIINVGMLLITFTGFVAYLVRGLKYRKNSNIYLP